MSETSAGAPETAPPEYPSPRIQDSRRLLGPSLFGPRPGVVLEVACTPTGLAVLDAWAEHARELAARLGWPDPAPQRRRWEGGAALYMCAPVDVLMTATEVAEQAWVAAEGGVPALDALRAAAEEERGAMPRLAAAYQAAVEHGVQATFDDEQLILGSGLGMRRWPLLEIPPADEIPWVEISSVPTTLVTGSNGKTTTTRLVAAMWRAAGRVTGWSCSDGVWLDDRQLATGDYSGPGGARTVLAEPALQAAVLETARGGIIRRGLAVRRATAAIITNLAADHFGEFGVETLDDLAEAKRTVARVLEPGGRLVLNADDVTLSGLGEALEVPVAWFSAAGSPVVTRAGIGACVEGGRLILYFDGRHDLGAIDEMPLSLGGSASYNRENLCGAAILGAVSGIPLDAIRETVLRFGGADNPGRLQLSEIGGVKAVVDYAHNPAGIASLGRAVQGIPAARRALVLGQAGDRPDDQVRELARCAWDAVHPDRILIKEMESLLRGRPAGEVPELLRDAFTRLGAGDRLELAGSELEAVRAAFAWARPGDLLVLPVHAQKEEVMAFMDGLARSGWRAGEAIPDL